jgi:type I restriction enzyme M protein
LRASDCQVVFGSTLSDDRHARRRFDYLIANPPYGKDWKRDEEAVRAEHERGAAGRFDAGLLKIHGIFFNSSRPC